MQEMMLLNHRLDGQSTPMSYKRQRTYNCSFNFHRVVARLEFRRVRHNRFDLLGQLSTVPRVRAYELTLLSIADRSALETVSVDFGAICLYLTRSSLWVLLPPSPLG